MVRRNLASNRILKKRSLTFEQGVLASRPVKPIPPKKETSMNQKELLRELKEMHEQNRALLEQIAQALSLLAQQGLVVNQAPATVSSSTQPRGQTKHVMMMDESTFVTKVDTSDLEKGYNEITETKSEKDEGLSSAKSKLSALKKRN